MNEDKPHVEDGEQEAQEDLLDLNEVMHSFGVHEWRNLGPTEPLQNEVIELAR